MKRTSFEFIRFALFAAVNSILTYVLYLLLLSFSPYITAFTLSYAAGIFLSYLLNSAFVFKRPLEWKKAIKFPVVYVVQYALSAVLLSFSIEVLGVDRLIAPWAVVVVVFPGTFLLTRSIIMGRQRAV